MMAGDIWLDSKLGYGSKFSFTAKFKLSEHASDFGSDFNWGNYTNLPNIQWLQVNPVSSNLLAQSLSNYPNSVTQRTECSDFDMATSDQLFIIDGDVDINNVTECLEKATSNSIRVIVTSILDTSDYPINLSEYPNTQLLVKPYLGHQLFELITETHNVTSESELLSPSKQTSQMNKLAGAHLLLVEDNELNQELATDLLASINITVDIANNGQEAVDKSEQGDYDGILMDIQMPVLDGISATKIIRQVDVKIPIIAMTANAMAGDREHVIEAGMNSYISKPIDFKLMIKTLSDWITPKHKEAPAQITETPKQPLSLPSFEHIDLEAGMIVTNNNSALYLKLLNKFSKAHKSFKEDLLVSLNDCDWETAIRLAHTLKGTSANIGAEKVQELAAILELECKREAVAQSTIDKCNETLTAVLTELSEKLAKDGDVKLSGNNKALNAADIAGELDELRSLIDDFDANAQDIVEILLTKNLEEALQNAIVNISKALENYDFERAEAELEKL